MLEAKRQKKYILTFGGAYSNHIVKLHVLIKFGFKALELLEERSLQSKLYFTCFAKENGMKIHYISREQYRKTYCKFYK